jgi:hypothetical protein
LQRENDKPPYIAAYLAYVILLTFMFFYTLVRLLEFRGVRLVWHLLLPVLPYR